MPDNWPTISIIIPTYNHDQFILGSLQSVMAQTYRNYEIIVINDGSPDNTGRMVEPYVASSRIKYIEQANAGQGAARNRGIAEAKGEFIAFLDDDDLWPPDKLEWQVRELQNHPDAVLVYGFMETFGDCIPCRHPEHKGPSGNVRRDLYRGNFLRSPGQTLIRSAALRHIAGFDPGIWGADDWDLWIRLSQTGHFIYVSRLALRYRIHPNNASRDVLRLYRNSLQVVRKNLGTIPNFNCFIDWLSSLVFIFLSLRPIIIKVISCKSANQSFSSKLLLSLFLLVSQIMGIFGKFILILINRFISINIPQPDNKESTFFSCH
jgi:glycosyltransferase involved in cell wall biosynthesis